MHKDPLRLERSVSSSARALTMLDSPTTQPERIAACADPADHEAWTWLHETYRTPIGDLCLRSGLTPVETDEVINDVLLRLSRRLVAKPFKSETLRFRAWLTQITHLRIFEVRRQRKHTQLTPEALTLMAEWLPGAFAPQTDLEARHQLEQHLWAVCLDRVRTTSTPRSWQIFETYCFHNRPSPEVAQAFNTTEFNVRIIRMRMVHRIRRQWAILAEEGLQLPDAPEQEAP